MDLSAWIWDKVDSDEELTEDEQYLILSAVDGEEAFTAHTGGATPPSPPAPVEDSIPQRAFLQSLRVEGYRGIGPAAELTFKPGPGLVVVAGRNGSGKSSFSEALDWTLRQTTTRAGKNAALWQDQWRNIHSDGPTQVRASFVVEGRGRTTVGIDWPKDAAPTGYRAWTQEESKPRVPGVDGLGWAGALELYSPMLSYEELGGIFEGKPSALYDALERFLGLERLTEACDRLKAHVDHLAAPRREADNLRKETVQMLTTLDDTRATIALNAMEPRAAKAPALTELDEILAGSTTNVDPAMGGLQALAGVQLPNAETVRQGRDALARAQSDLASAIDDATSAETQRAELLEYALKLHAEHGDRACPVCGAGVLDDAWRTRAEDAVLESREITGRLRGAKQTEEAARSAWTQLVPQRPPALDRDHSLASLAAARRAWTAWQEVTSDRLDDAEALAASYAQLALAQDALSREAKDEVTRRQDHWLDVLPQITRWRELHRHVAECDSKFTTAKRANEWLRKSLYELRNERLLPLADQARSIWAKLRQESNVDLGSITLESASTRRHVDLRGSVDGSETGTLAVMSQGELHALGLALFIPRACAPDSPFGFLVLDDPIQAMDPAKIDGFVDVLTEISQSRQVIVFSHDDRLADCLRRSSIPCTILEMVRGPGSTVDVRPLHDPVSRYFSDAIAITCDDAVSPEDQRRVIPGLCRMAVEVACQEIVYARILGAGRPRAEVEAEWTQATGTSQRVQAALALDHAGLTQWLKSRHKARMGLGICTRGFHRGLESTDPREAVRAAEALVEQLQVSA